MAKKTAATHSPLFEKYKTRYEHSGCTKAQLKKLVKLGALTPEEYTEITGDPYEV